MHLKYVLFKFQADESDPEPGLMLWGNRWNNIGTRAFISRDNSSEVEEFALEDTYFSHDANTSAANPANLG